MSPEPGAEFKRITAVWPMEVDALGVMEGLRREFGIVATDLHLGRGVSGLNIDELDQRLGGALEKKVLTAVVSADQAEAVFAYLYDEADMARPHGGIVYQQPLLRSTVFELPDLPGERR